MSEIKTKYMAFGKIKHIKLKFNGKLLEHVQSYKRLGNIISSIKTVTMDIFGENYSYLCEKSRKSTFTVLNKAKKYPHTVTVYFSYVPKSNTTDSVVW